MVLAYIKAGLNGSCYFQEDEENRSQHLRTQAEAWAYETLVEEATRERTITHGADLGKRNCSRRTNTDDNN